MRCAASCGQSRYVCLDNGKLPVQGVAGIRNFDRGIVKATSFELQHVISRTASNFKETRACSSKKSEIQIISTIRVTC